MPEPDPNRDIRLTDSSGSLEEVRPHYRWPWFVAAAVVLGLILFVVWVGYAALRESREHNFSAPLPSQTH